jgi:hypothetical protein
MRFDNSRIRTRAFSRFTLVEKKIANFDKMSFLDSEKTKENGTIHRLFVNLYGNPDWFEFPPINIFINSFIRYTVNNVKLSHLHSECSMLLNSQFLLKVFLITKNL